MENRAKEFATQAHAAANQKRKYTGEDYIVHPAAVVELVRSVPHTDDMLCAAWLHDVVEDTNIQLDEVARVFGISVATIVEQLTDVSKPSDGNRATRKAIDRDHLAKACHEAQTIKLADLIDNTITIVYYDPKFAKTYLREKRELLEVLTKGDITLYTRACSMVWKSCFV